MFTRDFFDKLMKWEGGYQNRSEDTGNYNACGQQVGTNRGITSKTVETLMGVRCPDAAFMQAIGEDYAFSVLTKFWDFYRVDEIADQAVAELVFNAFMGLPTAAAKSVQKACNRYQANLAVDGVMGSKTLAALNSLINQNLPKIYNAILQEWIAYLNTVNPTFRQGLLNRVNDLFKPMPEGSTNTAGTPVTTDNPVADTGGPEYAARVLSGALKFKSKDLVAVLTVVVGLVLAIASVRFLLVGSRRSNPQMQMA